MSYHDLSQCTLTSEERRQEADELLDIINELARFTKLSDKEEAFVAQMDDPLADVSVKQLFWLRDIKDKYL